MIPEAAVEAAVIAMYGQARKDNKTLHKAMRLVLEAAVPHMVKRVTTREGLDALHYDAVVLSNTIAYQNCGDDSWAAAGRFYDGGQISLPAYIIHEPTVPT